MSSEQQPDYINPDGPLPLPEEVARQFWNKTFAPTSSAIYKDGKLSSDELIKAVAVLVRQSREEGIKIGIGLSINRIFQLKTLAHPNAWNTKTQAITWLQDLLRIRG